MKSTSKFPPLANSTTIEKNEYKYASDEERMRALAVANEKERAICEAERLFRTGISRSTWFRLNKKNAVPRPLKDDNRSRWLISEILVFNERRNSNR